MQWSHWFAGMMDVQPIDRMYNCLPMYHSVGGVQAPGAVLVAGGAVVIREKFSASQFWSDILRWDCTLFQYIGELCRYLLHTRAVRAMRRSIGSDWPAATDWRRRSGRRFKTAFAFREFSSSMPRRKAASRCSMCQGKRGAIGHIPSYLEHRFSPALVRFDVETGRAGRAMKQGFCIRCAPNEAGEALGKVVDDPANVGSRFEGYTSRGGFREREFCANVFEPGDAWVRTGDLMRKDEKGFFYFVDRIGDTFRWKGENVAPLKLRRRSARFRESCTPMFMGLRCRARRGGRAWPHWSLRRGSWIWRVASASDRAVCRRMRGRCFCAFAARSK